MKDHNLDSLKDDIARILVEITEMQEKIKSFTEQVGGCIYQRKFWREFNKHVKALIATGGVFASQAGAACMTALGVFCPLLILSAMAWAGVAITSGVLAGMSLVDLQAHESNLRYKQLELQNKQASLQELEKVTTILEPMQSDMALICEKLAVFSGIWTMISADLVAIEKTMHLANSAMAAKLFNKRLDTVASAYKLLHKALYQYETAVHK